MKKIIYMILAAIMLLSITACGGNETTPTETTDPPTTESIPVCEANGHTWTDAICETAKTAAKPRARLWRAMNGVLYP